MAWEYQVDTGILTGQNKVKRDAIKRAHYIHRHRGTVAAVRHALVDSPFGTDIVEMVQSEPERGSVYLSPERVSERFAGDGIRPAGSKTGGAARREPAQLVFRSCIWPTSGNLVCGRLHVRHGENHAALCIPLRVDCLSRYELNLWPR
ncbi:phage tail protein I [Klebsiella pneumoniae subsp. pneumoniae]|nr:phage tail protein I [Klebsiella pneumoniae subsp. pneumoniae]